MEHPDTVKVRDNIGACEPSRRYWTASASYTAKCGNGDSLTWGWMPAGIEPISGLVLLRSSPRLVFLAAHDATSPGGYPLSIIEFKDGVLSDQWPVSLTDAPADIEGLARLSSSRYCLINSAGTVLTFTLNEDETEATEIIRQGVAGSPWSGDSQIESLSIRKLWNQNVAIWATRGNGATPSRIFFGVVSEGGNVFTANYPTPSTFYSAPWPTPDQRHINALHIDKAGIVYASAATDQGNSGPFSSAIYRIGSFANGSPLPVFTLDGSPTEIYRTTNHKSEAIAAVNEDNADFGLILGSDDESLGGSIFLEKPPIGRTLTITRVGISHLSQEDARINAARLAKTEALAEIKCYFEGSGSAQPYCSGDYYDAIVRTAWNSVSQAEANQDAQDAAEAAAAEWCETEIDQEPPPVINGDSPPLNPETLVDEPGALLVDEDLTPFQNV